jgi:thioredoxin reductase (NADPH)
MNESGLDLVIIGAGPSGLATAIEAQLRNLRAVVLDKGCITNSIYNFPPHMVFFTTPELLEIGNLPLVTDREKPTRNESLKYYRRVVGTFKLDVRQYQEVTRIEQTLPHAFKIHTTAAVYEARNVVIATGYYDNPNYMGIPGEDLPHVSHYYSEPHSFYGRDVVVIGGKNSAAEAALDLFRAGARATLVHRGTELGKNVKYWVKPDIENRIKAQEVKAYFNTQVLKIALDHVKVLKDGGVFQIKAEQVFALTGYHSDTKFYDQLGIPYDPETLRPQYDPQTYETCIPGVYLAGGVVGGRFNGDIFIENGRLHGGLVAKSISTQSH